VLQSIALQHSRDPLNWKPDAIRVLCPEAPPGLVDLVRERPEIQAIFGKNATRPAATICTVGRTKYREAGQVYGPHEGTSTYVRMVANALLFQRLTRDNKLSKEDVYNPIKDEVYRDAYDQLHRAGIIGDICAHGIKVDGEIVEGFWERTSLAVHPERLLRWRLKGTKTIAAVGGSGMAPTLKAGLKARLFSTLVVDVALGLQLLEPRARPKAYRDVPEVR
jgi:hypothetical protein